MISFVVPAYNEALRLAATLDAIHAAALAVGADYEIVVADDASTDTTAAVASGHGARVVYVEHRQIARTRNAGARAARGERLFFVDADTQVNARVVRAALAALDAGAVGGGATPVFEPGAPRWTHPMMWLVTRTMRLAGLAAGCFVYARRDAFEAVGGFDERHFAGEEVMLSLALGRRGRFVILREPVTTSARKFVARTPWQTLALALRIAFGGMRGVRRREGTEFWYDGKR
ncbi:MAG TPA: glycosyltransferase [Myxococcota bacterium]|nr:glycosyltransferase [Myxococcota bacterium]